MLNWSWLRIVIINTGRVPKASSKKVGVLAAGMDEGRDREKSVQLKREVEIAADGRVTIVPLRIKYLSPLMKIDFFDSRR